MAKRERVDSKKNKAKVIKAVLKNPLQTEREIAKATGVSKSTAHNKLTEIDREQTKDDRIQGIVDKDLEIVTLGQEIINHRLKKIKESLDDPTKQPEEKISAKDISGIIRENTARYTLFKGDVTDKHGGLKAQENLQEKTLKELEEIRQSILNK